MNHNPENIQHLASCGDCQEQSAREASDVDLPRVWAGVAAQVWAPRITRTERVLLTVLRSPALARALVVTPSLLLSWILASAAVLAVGAFFTSSTGTPWVALITPALAGAGIAYAYGPGVDPAFEIAQTTPTSHRMVLLVRALAVFGVNAALGLIASLVSPVALTLTLGWLIPMTTVSAIGLASATLARSANAGVGAAVMMWGLIVVSSARGTANLSVAVTDQRLIPFYLAATVVLSVVVLYASSSRRERAPRWQLP